MEDLFLQFITNYGLIGMFFTAIILNASILLPTPLDFLFIAVSGFRLYNPVLLGIVVGLGAAIGELAGYCIGYFGSKTLEKFTKSQMQRIYDFKNRVKEFGTLFVFIGAVIPFPFDLIGIAAGLVKFDVKRFFIAAFCGRTLRYVLIACAVYYGLEAIQAFFSMGA